MTISALLSPQRIFLDPEITSKKKLLEFIATAVSEQTGLTQSTIFTNLLDRERLGSTGLGRGFAVPHARMAGIDSTTACFIRLQQAVNFEAPDGQPVDLIFAIIIPEEATDEHLQILSALARIFSQEEICLAIRAAGSTEEIIQIVESAEQ